MSHYLIGSALAVLAAVAGPAAQARTPRAVVATTIYTGGDILTMATDTPTYVQAIGVAGGRIIYAGKLSKAPRNKSTRIIDLHGQTLLPGFIDGHGHMIAYGKNLVDADLVGSKSVAEIVDRMKAQAAKVGPGEWIVGFGFSGPQIAEQRYPTAAELDAVSMDRPVMAVDGSGHIGSVNNAAFRAAGITAATANPEGGAFYRQADGKSLDGKVEETGLNAVRIHRPAFTGKLADDVALGGARDWVANGLTTAQDCGVGLGSDDIDIVRNAIDKRLLPIDLYICAKDTNVDAMAAAAQRTRADYIGVAGSDDARQSALVAEAAAAPGDGAALLLSARPDLDKRYVNRVRLGGIKFWLDGSLPTAWMTKPYTNPPPGKPADYVAFQQIPDAVLDAAFDKYWTTNVQINMHMNGDAAADQALNSIERAARKYGMRDHRPVFIHASYLRPDQIARMKAVGGVPSFLSGGLAGGGDTVVKLWGPDRAAHAMAANTVFKAGIPFSLSADAPVSPSPSVLNLVDAAVNRMTTSGNVIGPDERISPYVGLRAVTAWAAFQIKEEKTKGTLEVGKLADLVILDRNPLKVPPTSIRTITVMQTIKEDKPVFTRAEVTARAPSPGVHDEDVAAASAPLTPRAEATIMLLTSAAGRP